MELEALTRSLTAIPGAPCSTNVKRGPELTSSTLGQRLSRVEAPFEGMYKVHNEPSANEFEWTLAANRAVNRHNGCIES